MYDELSDDYDRFVNWPSRLAYEMPFLERELNAAGARKVLDAACGSGQHAIALAKRGFDVTGADASVAMIELARRNALDENLSLSFHVAGFGEMRERTGEGFDALICLGNSLPHLLDPASLAAALGDMAECLRPGGLLLIQNRNFDRVVAHRERWMEPQSHREDDREWLFLRFYDWQSDGLIGFNILTLQRQGDDAWTQRVSHTLLRPQPRAELESAVAQAGFHDLRVFGDMTGSPYEVDVSGNLILTARRGMVTSALHR